jgi:hypothetical protein
VGPRAGLDDVEKRKFLTLLRLELRPLGRPSRSQSLYRLPYDGSYNNIICDYKLRGLFIICYPVYETECKAMHIRNRACAVKI